MKQPTLGKVIFAAIVICAGCMFIGFCFKGYPLAAMIFSVGFAWSTSTLIFD